MKLSITSNGGPIGTKIVNIETGEDISSQVYSLEFLHHVGDTPLLRITFLGSVIDELNLDIDDSDEDGPNCLLN